MRFAETLGESSNGRTADSGSVYRGSNPLSPANVVPSSSGQDVALSRPKHGFDSRWDYQIFQMKENDFTFPAEISASTLTFPIIMKADVYSTGKRLLSIV